MQVRGRVVARVLAVLALIALSVVRVRGQVVMSEACTDIQSTMSTCMETYRGEPTPSPNSCACVRLYIEALDPSGTCASILPSLDSRRRTLMATTIATVSRTLQCAPALTIVPLVDAL